MRGATVVYLGKSASYSISLKFAAYTNGRFRGTSKIQKGTDEDWTATVYNSNNGPVHMEIIYNIIKNQLVEG